MYASSLSVITNRFEISNLDLTLTSLQFRGNLNYVGQLGQQKVMSGSIKSRKSLTSDKSMNYIDGCLL